MSRLPGVGETFGRYRLEQKLGQGGMGVVYAAVDTVLNRRVALKLVAPHLAEDPEFGVRFAREAETQARLDSPHVVRINDYGEHDGVLFLSTQLVDGGDLASRVAAGGALEPPLAVEVAAQVLDGLEDAHQAGVVHRDVKPANVLLADRGGAPRAYLCDFGIATTAGQGLTRTGQVIGSLPWMAPERHYGKDAGAAGDVYSAGCLFWYALTGAPPYVGSDGEVMRGHLEGLVPQLAGTSPFVKRANAVLLKALTKEPAERYASAAAMATEVRALAAIAPGAVQAADAAPTTIRSAATRPATAARSTAAPRWRWALPALVAASMLAAVAGGLGVRAFVDDDPALAAGATQIEVAGRTVTVQPTRTISPLAPRQGAALPGAAVGADAGVVGADAGVAGTGGVVGGAEAQGGSGTGGAAGTSGESTAERTQAAAPSYRYSCWNGQLTTTTCSYPIDAAGADWMFPATRDLSCPAAMPVVGSHNGIHDSYRCSYSGGTGSNAIYLMRLSSQTQADNWLKSVMTVEINNTWSDGQDTAGRSLKGTGTHNGTKQYRWGRYWYSSGNTWMAFVNASTASALNDGIGKLSFRALRHVTGVPCSETRC